MTTYRDAGFVAAAFRNFLALLGWSAGEEKEIYSMDELIEKFSLDGIHRSNAVFNFHPDDPRKWTDDKALWMNAEYIRTMPLTELLPLLKNELKSAKLWRDEYEEWETFARGHHGEDRQERLRERVATEGPLEIGSAEWFVYTADLIRQRFFTLKDFSSQGRAYFSEDFDFDAAAVAKNLAKFPELKKWMPELADRLHAEFGETNLQNSHGLLPFTEDRIEVLVKAFTEEKGTKLGVIMNGARTLLTGVGVGPSMLSVFEVVGLERTLMRLRSQVAWNE